MITDNLDEPISPFQIWIDADAVPGPVKEIVITAALKRKIKTIFVANKPIAVPPSPIFSFVLVNKTPDAADYYINDQASILDFVITQDIPLAHLLVKRGVTVINPRGLRFTEDNIGERLSVRDLMEQLRDQRQMTGGPAKFGDKEKRAFAASFDRELTRLIRQTK